MAKLPTFTITALISSEYSIEFRFCSVHGPIQDMCASCRAGLLRTHVNRRDVTRTPLCTQVLGILPRSQSRSTPPNSYCQQMNNELAVLP